MVTPLISTIIFQLIQVNSTTPCFLNKTAGFQIFQNCIGQSHDWLQALLMAWQWITGGYFSLAIVILLILFTYIKYHKILYPIVIGILFMPISLFLFPTPWAIIGIILGSVGIFVLFWHGYINQTTEN